jgi:hypothetical protein
MEGFAQNSIWYTNLPTTLEDVPIEAFMTDSSGGKSMKFKTPFIKNQPKEFLDMMYTIRKPQNVTSHSQYTEEKLPRKLWAEACQRAFLNVAQYLQRLKVQDNNLSQLKILFLSIGTEPSAKGVPPFASEMLVRTYAKTGELQKTNIDMILFGVDIAPAYYSIKKFDREEKWTRVMPELGAAYETAEPVRTQGKGSVRAVDIYGIDNNSSLVDQFKNVDYHTRKLVRDGDTRYLVYKPSEILDEDAAGLINGADIILVGQCFCNNSGTTCQSLEISKIPEFHRNLETMLDSSNPNAFAIIAYMFIDDDLSLRKTFESIMEKESAYFHITLLDSRENYRKADNSIMYPVMIKLHD